jgi:hypothetical protein
MRCSETVVDFVLAAEEDGDLMGVGLSRKRQAHHAVL